MGRYRCPACGLERPAPAVRTTRLDITPDASESVIETPAGEVRLRLPLPGVYNAYNALAATAVAVGLGVRGEAVSEATARFQAAFGRVERLAVGDKQVALLLVKNPTGFNEVLRTVCSGAEQRHVLIMINDLFADGTDVSWLWDVDFEVMRGKVARATVSGIRARDMALRLHYAGVAPATGDVVVQERIPLALTHAIESTPPGGTLYVLPTYTAMLEVKDDLARRGLAPRWQDD
jgi:UDP-N-acetylmuramyl tripeptide synthase